MVKIADLKEGQEMIFSHGPITRTEIYKYGKGSKDTNGIHMDDAFAVQMNLKGVIAHGMLSFGTTIADIVSWLGETGELLAIDCQMRGMVRPGDLVKSIFKIEKIEGKNVKFTWEQYARCPINITKDGEKVVSFEAEERGWISEKDEKKGLIKEEELSEPLKWVKTEWTEPFPSKKYEESVEEYSGGGTLKLRERLSLQGSMEISLKE